MHGDRVKVHVEDFASRLADGIGVGLEHLPGDAAGRARVSELFLGHDVSARLAADELFHCIPPAHEVMQTEWSPSIPRACVPAQYRAARRALLSRAARAGAIPKAVAPPARAR